MKNFFFLLGGGLVGMAVLAVAFSTRADQLDSASCGAMTIADQCRISWSFSRSSDSYYWVQQFDPREAVWHSLTDSPVGTSPQGIHDKPVEAGYLYRVLACDDAETKTNCSGSTMVWAPFIQTKDQVHLIPSRVPLGPSGEHIATVNKELGWLTQVIQYNVYQLINAIARTEIGDLPEMTPVTDIRLKPPEEVQPIEQLQFNVFWAYSAERGVPMDSPMPEQVPRAPHEHPERHPQ